VHIKQIYCVCCKTKYVCEAAERWTQSRTGAVLGAVPSAAVMGARKIFSRGGGKFKDAKSWRPFREDKCPQNTSLFSKGAPVFVDGSACAMAQWTVQAWLNRRKKCVFLTCVCVSYVIAWHFIFYALIPHCFNSGVRVLTCA